MALRILSRSLVLRLTITLISLLISNYPYVKYETNLIKTYGLFFFNVLNCLHLIRNFYIYVTSSVTCPVVLTGCGIRVGFFFFLADCLSFCILFSIDYDLQHYLLVRLLCVLPQVSLFFPFYALAFLSLPSSTIFPHMTITLTSEELT